MIKYSDKGALLFHAGFNGAALVPEDAKYIIGSDGRYPEFGNWEKDIQGNPALGNITIEYEGGTLENRHAKLVSDPAGSGYTVLEFYLKDAVLHRKGRVQASLYGNKGFYEVYFKVRAYLHPDMKLLESYPRCFEWLTLSEFWNEPFWDNNGFPFRVTLNIAKDAGVGRKLHFRLNAQILTRDMLDLWEEYNREFEIPFGEWMTFEYYYKQGNLHTGRFTFDVTTSDNVKHEIFDIHNWTQHPCNPDAAGLTHFNPMKVYTSDTLIDHVRNNGGVMRVYWDDFELRNLSKSKI